MKAAHQVFAVGRLAKGDRRLLVLETPAAPAPIRGPWELRAVFAK